MVKRRLLSKNSLMASIAKPSEDRAGAKARADVESALADLEGRPCACLMCGAEFSPAESSLYPPPLCPNCEKA